MRDQQKTTPVIGGEFNIEAAVIVTDPWIIAALTASGCICRLLTGQQGVPLAVYEDYPKFRNTLERFGSHKLRVDARDCWAALDELNWKLADEEFLQAHQQ